MESNSVDRTKALLTTISTQLRDLQVAHRFVLRDDTDEKDSQGNTVWPPKKWWPHGTSPERITFLAGVRNEALAPLQSSNPEIRLPDYAQFSKILFLNDIYFTWQSLVNLLETRLPSPAKTDGKSAHSGPTDYDLACATDFGNAGKPRYPLSLRGAADLLTPAICALARLLQAFTIPG